MRRVRRQPSLPQDCPDAWLQRQERAAAYVLAAVVLLAVPALDKDLLECCLAEVPAVVRVLQGLEAGRGHVRGRDRRHVQSLALSADVSEGASTVERIQVGK